MKKRIYKKESIEELDGWKGGTKNGRKDESWEEREENTINFLKLI